MERIRLTKNEKRLLRNIASGASYWPDGMSDASVAACADVLKDKGLIEATFASGHEVVFAEITHKGVMYLQENPHLRNPVDRKWLIATIIAIASVTTAILASFVACRTF